MKKIKYTLVWGCKTTRFVMAGNKYCFEFYFHPWTRSSSCIHPAPSVQSNNPLSGHLLPPQPNLDEHTTPVSYICMHFPPCSKQTLSNSLHALHAHRYSTDAHVHSSPCCVTMGSNWQLEKYSFPSPSFPSFCLSLLLTTAYACPFRSVCVCVYNVAGKKG